MGGFFRGAPWAAENSDKVRYAYAFVWGVVSSAPKINTKTRKPCTQVVIRYKSGSRLVCRHWGNDSVTFAMQQLEKGEPVVVFGIYENVDYVNKNGVQKKSYYLHADFVASQRTLSFVSELMRSPSMEQLLKMDSRFSDKLESVEDDEDDEDFDDYEQGEIYDDIGF